MNTMHGQGVIVDIGVDVKDLILNCNPSTLPALLSILQQIPGWSQEAASAAECSKISGAMTNLVFKISSSLAADNTTVIFRVFGQGGRLFSRHQEAGVFYVASDLSIGPKCLVRFSNGRVEQFVPGNPLTAAAMRDPDTSRDIARCLVEFHVRMYQALPAICALSEDSNVPRGLDTPGEHDFVQGSSPRAVDTGDAPALWPRLKEWLETAIELAPEVVKELNLEPIGEEIDALQLALAATWGPPWLCFCHNDLQHGNILTAVGFECEKRPQNETDVDDGGGGFEITRGPSSTTTSSQHSLTIIDYEYASVGDVAFDIANHWCEWAADYQSSEGSDIDFSRMPGPAQQTRFCLAYIWHLLTNHPASPAAVTARIIAMKSQDRGQYDKIILELKESGLLNALLVENGPIEVPGFSQDSAVLAAELLRHRALCCIPLSHLKWGLWGLMQWKLSNVEFDYLGYAKLRLKEYHATKGVLVGSGCAASLTV